MNLGTQDGDGSEKGWGAELRSLSPETVVVPIVGNSESPGMRIGAEVA
jgi:hypothetical protein